MENETTEAVDSTNNENEVVETTEKVEVEKKEFTPEEQLAIHRRETKKLEKKLGLETETPSQPKSDELGSGEKALLVAYGVKGRDELELAKTWMKRTGDDIDALIEDSIFQAKLNGLREAKASADAIPKGQKRSSTGSVNDVDYWIAKGELPPDTAENRELRTKIVNAEIKTQKDASPFKVGGNKLIIQ